MHNEVDIVRQAFALTKDAEVASLCGVIPQAVHNWRRHNRIPPARLFQLAKLARERGCDLPEQLWKSGAVGGEAA